MVNLIKRMMTVLVAGSIVTGASRVQAALSAGDIALIGVNSDNNANDKDEIAFVALVNISADEVIHFTDKGWITTNFWASEGIHDYTVPVGGISAGTIIQLELSGPQLSASGDQVLVYQGSVTSPEFIYAINLEGTGVWQESATNSNTSALPPGLVNGTTCLALPEYDNAYFKTESISSGTQAEWLAAIGNPGNWMKSNSYLTLPGGMISTTSAGVDLRAYVAAEGTFVEFTAYDVESDGEIKLAQIGENGEILWEGVVRARVGPEFTARFCVAGLERGQSYEFKLRDEVGKWWTADRVLVGRFDTELTEMSLSGFTLTFNSVPGQVYEIQWTPELGSAWVTVDTVEAENGLSSVLIAPPDSSTSGGFFRTRLN